MHVAAGLGDVGRQLPRAEELLVQPRFHRRKLRRHRPRQIEEALQVKALRQGWPARQQRQVVVGGQLLCTAEYEGLGGGELIAQLMLEQQGHLADIRHAPHARLHGVERLGDLGIHRPAGDGGLAAVQWQIGPPALIDDTGHPAPVIAGDQQRQAAYRRHFPDKAFERAIVTIGGHGCTDVVDPVDKLALGLGKTRLVLEQYALGARQVGGAERTPFVVVEDHIAGGKKAVEDTHLAVPITGIEGLELGKLVRVRMHPAHQFVARRIEELVLRPALQQQRKVERRRLAGNRLGGKHFAIGQALENDTAVLAVALVANALVHIACSIVGTDKPRAEGISKAPRCRALLSG